MHDSPAAPREIPRFDPAPPADDTWLDLLGVPSCLLDASGTIALVNRQWRDRAATTPGAHPAAWLGENYLATCERTIGDDRDAALRMAVSIRRVLAGQLAATELEYACEYNGTPFWYVARLTRATIAGRVVAVVSHHDVSREHKIAERLQTLAAVVENAPVSIVVTDHHANIEYANLAFCEISGYPREEVIGSRPSLLNSHLNPAGTYEDLWNTILSGKIWRGELINRRKDGSLYTERSVIAPVLDQAGRVKQFIGIKEDVTELRRAEEALRAKETALRMLADNAQDIIFRYRVKPTAAFEYVSPAVLRVSGYTPEEHYENPQLIFEAVHPDDRHLLHSLTTNPEPGNAITTLRWRHKAGHFIWTEQRSTPIFDADGQFVALEGIARDITRQKEIEQRLRQSSEALQEAQRISRLGSWSWHIADDIVVWSEELYRIFGLDPTQRAPNWVEHSKLYTPESLQRLDTAVKLALETGQPYELDLEGRHKSGAPRYILARGKVARDASGAITRLLGTVLDITARREAELALRRERDFVGAILETSGALIVALDTEGCIVRFNRAAELLTGYSTSEVANLPLIDILISREERATFHQAFQQVVGGGSTTSGENHWITKDGARRLILWRLTAIRNESDAIEHLIATGIDITEKRWGEEQLRLAARILDCTTEGVMITDAHRRIIEVNPAFSAITGYTREEVIGKTTKLLHGTHHPPDFFDTIWYSIARSRNWQGEVWYRRKSGEEYPQWLTVSSVLSESDEVTNYVIIFNDITALKESQQRLDYLAHHDALTGLPNRMLFEARLEHSIQRARRDGSMIAVLFIDLDHFKNVNDTLGHQIGDQLLCEVSRRMQAQLRSIDTLSRLGGDEFTIILEGLNAPSEAARVTERLIASLAGPILVSGHELFPGMSAGIAVFPTDAHDMGELLQKADAAMYQAKSSGRNRFVFHRPEITARVQERVRMETALRGAVEGRQLCLHFQPILDLRRSDRIVAVEALLRWQHPELGTVMPAQFIPVAEECGAIVRLGEWAIREACRQLAAWRRNGLELERISVNLSVIQLERSDIAEVVRGALRESGLAGSSLALELTESVIMQRTESPRTALAALRDMGVLLSIDDFGTGCSSLRYLRELPIQSLKIDQSFTRTAPTTPGDLAILRAIVSLAHSMGRVVIAEGVETPEQLAVVRAEQCDEAQGFLLGAPMTAPELEERLRSGK